MTRRQKRLIAIVVILTLLLAALAGYFYFYKRTKQLSFNISAAARGTIPPPQFLYSFSGKGFDRLQRPIGVAVIDGTVYVADSVRARIFTYNENGEPKGSFGASETVNPLYIAENPKDSNVYVTDRRKCAILKFTKAGKFLGEFDPKLPKDQLPEFETRGVQWQPIAIAFASDGSMFVTDILNGHRLLIFGPDGSFKKSVGTVGIVKDPSKAPEFFQFPNGVVVVGDEVYVADSNNQRVKVYDKEGEYKRTIVTAGLPRGIIALDRFKDDDQKAPLRIVTVDTLGHDATIWTAKGEKILNFGEQGVLEGQFSYPSSAGKGTANKIFVADTANGRVQVWGWPEVIANIPQIEPNNLIWCLVPLLLLPFLLLLRKKQYFATADFVTAIIDMGEADVMPGRTRKWITSESEYEKIRELRTDTVDFGELFQPSEYSESDVNALVEKYEIEFETAVSLSLAVRAHLACTESQDLRRLIKTAEARVVDAAEFVERFAKKSAKSKSSI